jgi:hypothetical protein
MMPEASFAAVGSVWPSIQGTAKTTYDGPEQKQSPMLRLLNQEIVVIHVFSSIPELKLECPSVD